jgi:putative phosphoesterase
MLVLVITDLHGRYNYPREVKKELNCAELIVIAGDLTDFGGEREAETVLGGFSAYKDKLLAVNGNCDRPGVNKVLTEWGINLHGDGRIVQGVGFFGLGGSGITPFHTPQENTEDELAVNLIAGWAKIENCRTRVLVSHPPPKDCKLDRTNSGAHAGSEAVRNFIDEHQPELVLCGHIHEAKGFDKIGKTIVINPGPFPYGYAWVEIGEKITFRFSTP